MFGRVLRCYTFPGALAPLTEFCPVQNSLYVQVLRSLILPALLQRRRSPEANQTLHDVCPSPGHYTLYIHFRGVLPSDGILPDAKFTLRPSLAFSYIVSVTVRHSSSGRQPNFAAWYKEWNYGTLAEGATYIWLGGHHVGHRPTF